MSPALAGRFFTASTAWEALLQLSILALILVQENSHSFPFSLVNNLPAMQETLVRFLGQEDPLEKG